MTNLWTTRPTIIIKRLSTGKYTWYLFLSNNRKKPTCVSPGQYVDAFKARSRAKAFAAKFKGPLRLIDKENKMEDIVVIDETKILGDESHESFDEVELDDPA